MAVWLLNLGSIEASDAASVTMALTLVNPAIFAALIFHSDDYSTEPPREYADGTSLRA